MTPQVIKPFKIRWLAIVTMAVPFLSLLPNSLRHSTPFALSLQPTALSRVCNSFQTSEPILPLLFIGSPHSPAADLLSALISASPQTPESNFDLSNLSPSSFDKIEGKSIAVWPYPVYVGRRTTLLLRMWDFNVGDVEGETWEMVRRALAGVLRVAAYCFVSFSGNSKFTGLEAVQEIYEALKARTGVEIAQFIYLEPASKAPLHSSLLKESTDYASYNKYTTFVSFTAASGLVSVAQGLMDSHPASNYLKTHYNLPSRDRPIEKICKDVEKIVKVSNLDIPFSAFIDNIPTNSQEECISHPLEKLRETPLPQSKLTIRPLEKPRETPLPQSKLTVRPLFTPGAVVDEELLNLVRTNFDPAKPTVVMVVLGGQGMGKSTFCNHMIQHCSQSRICQDYFHTANSTTHTTRGSHLLTSPLALPSSPAQLLLIDMEGLGGTETLQEKLAILQSNLVGVVLAVASVPCFLVRNEVETMRNVEKYVEKLVWLTRTFGFLMERILFLFHDKDFSPSQRTENREISNWIQQLNHHYFSDSPVIILLNKPNFVDPSKSDMRKSFLFQVLLESDFPKRSISGEFLKIRELLVQIRHLGEGLERECRGYSTGERDLQGLKSMEQVKKEELERLVLATQSTRTTSLVLVFNERSRNFLASLDNIRENQKVKRHLRAYLEDRVQEARWSLMAVEALYMSIATLTDSQLQAKIEEKAQELYSDAFWLPTFLSKCSSLETSLNQVSTHYPHMRPRVALALNYLEKEKSSSKWKSAANYALNVGLTVATGGLGAAASGTRLAVTAASKTKVAVTAVKYTWAALTTLKWSVDLVSSLRSKKPSPALKVEGDSVSWDSAAMQALSSGADKCVVLVLGREGLGIDTVLNSVLSSLSGMELSAEQELTSSDNVQIAVCLYPARHCQCLLFYLQLSASVSSKSDSTISAMASTFFPYVSCVCIFNNQESGKLMNIVSDGLSGSSRRRPVLTVFSWAGGRKEHESRLRELSWQTGLSVDFKEIESLEGRGKEIVRISLTERLLDARVFPSAEIDRMVNEVKRSLRQTTSFSEH